MIIIIIVDFSLISTQVHNIHILSRLHTSRDEEELKSLGSNSVQIHQ